MKKVVGVVNAMTDDNHPCEMMSDLYSLSKIRASFLEDEYLDFFDHRAFTDDNPNGPCITFIKKLDLQKLQEKTSRLS